LAGRPHDLAFAPEGRLWVTDWDGPLRVVTPDGRVAGSVALGDESHHLAFSADGARVWVSDAGDRTLLVVDTAGLAVVARIRLAGAPHHLADRRPGAGRRQHPRQGRDLRRADPRPAR